MLAVNVYDVMWIPIQKGTNITLTSNVDSLIDSSVINPDNFFQRIS